ncbi:putative nuclease HARBI1 [Bufo gargarizans]|uniref:putative nuclease HARBI1 n=1 Tax=Bufo gargarizans TaxID=30331 RepID=UPI001CF1F090|nr:putative nuclease HARBI1 [Bufo gargarizans]
MMHQAVHARLTIFQACIILLFIHFQPLLFQLTEQRMSVMDLHAMFHIHEKSAQQKLLQQESNPNQKHRERIFRPRISLFGLNEDEVRSRYRFSTEVILELYEQIQQDIEPNCERNHAVPGMVKLLSALHYFSSASFQGTVSALSGISQPSFSRHLTQVLKAINKLTTQYIVFPSDKTAIQIIKDGFYKMSSFPNVMGIIDCTHVALSPPTEDIYRNSKNFHSLNVQMVCDSDMRILNLVAGYPGSTHDSYILKHSSLHAILSSGNLPEGWILGDDAYPLTEWLLTPIKDPKTKAEKQYNAAHNATHSVIERTFGSLKSRFRCLDRSGGVLQYSPEKGAQIILACCILHNLAVSRKLDVDIVDDLEVPPPVPPVSKDENTQAGKRIRSKVITRYFT